MISVKAKVRQHITYHNPEPEENKNYFSFQKLISIACFSFCTVDPSKSVQRQNYYEHPKV